MLFIKLAMVWREDERIARGRVADLFHSGVFIISGEKRKRRKQTAKDKQSNVDIIADDDVGGRWRGSIAKILFVESRKRECGVVFLFHVLIERVDYDDGLNGNTGKGKTVDEIAVARRTNSYGGTRIAENKTTVEQNADDMRIVACVCGICDKLISNATWQGNQFGNLIPRIGVD